MFTEFGLLFKIMIATNQQRNEKQTELMLAPKKKKNMIHQIVGLISNQSIYLFYVLKFQSEEKTKIRI